MSRTKPLVVFTDETNGQYISSITEALAPPLFPRLVLGDSILRNQSALARADNYMLYCAMQLLREKVSLRRQIQWRAKRPLSIVRR